MGLFFVFIAIIAVCGPQVKYSKKMPMFSIYFFYENGFFFSFVSIQMILAQNAGFGSNPKGTEVSEREGVQYVKFLVPDSVYADMRHESTGWSG